MTLTLARPATTAPAASSGRARVVAFWTVAVVVPLLFLGVFFAWPVAVMVGKGFVLDGQLDLSGFAEVFSSPRTWRLTGLPVAQAALGPAISCCSACRARTCSTGTPSAG